MFFFYSVILFYFLLFLFLLPTSFSSSIFTFSQFFFHSFPLCMHDCVWLAFFSISALELACKSIYYPCRLSISIRIYQSIILSINQFINLPTCLSVPQSQLPNLIISSSVLLSLFLNPKSCWGKGIPSGQDSKTVWQTSDIQRKIGLILIWFQMLESPTRSLSCEVPLSRRKGTLSLRRCFCHKDCFSFEYCHLFKASLHLIL